MELKLKNLALRTVTYDDLNEVARMWNFEKGEISLDEEDALHYYMTFRDYKGIYYR